MTAHPLFLSLLLAGCLGAGTDASSPRTASSPLSTPPRNTAASADTVDIGRLRACITPDGPPADAVLQVIGQTSYSDGALVEVAWMEDERAAMFPSGATLVIRGPECHVLGGDDSDDVWRTARALQADPETRNRLIAAQIERVGGLSAFQAAIEEHRGEDWIRPRECSPDEPIAEGLCLRTPEAAAWRRAGLDVPYPHLGAASSPTLDLSQVPERLHTCLPASLRDEEAATDVEVLYLQQEGPEEVVVLATYPDGWVISEGLTPDIIVARVSSQVACSVLFDARADSWVDAPHALLARDLLRSEALRRRRAEIEVRRGGGPDGYLRLYREQTGTERPTACPAVPPEGYEGRCADAVEAETLRRLGVPVASG